ncbi:hypothetical protein [Paenibacillus sp. DYY-L-2]|uniref:hypothetical protein n=1 Tax=Paenibacillus sp. DYY-L-2 TaxID=3447013 RepID=UPI003F50745C
MRLWLYCDFVVEEVRPLQLIVETEAGELDWSENLYLPLAGPFERWESEQFADLTGVSVLLEDLILKRSEDEELGILLPQIARRHPGTDIQLLIVQIPDAEEVLGFKWGERLMDGLA